MQNYDIECEIPSWLKACRISKAESSAYHFLLSMLFIPTDMGCDEGQWATDIYLIFDASRISKRFTLYVTFTQMMSGEDTVGLKNNHEKCLISNNFQTFIGINYWPADYISKKEPS